jgi:DNA primase
MKRFSENLMLVLDADTAGLSATARSAALALRAGLRVKAARLPAGKDPADLITEDAAEFGKRVSGAKPIVEFFLAELAERERDPHRLLRSVEEIVLPLLRAVPSPMEREHFTQSTARTLGLSVEAVREALRRVSVSTPKQANPVESTNIRGAAPAEPRRSLREVREEQILAAIHAYPGTPLADRLKTEYSRITEAGQLPLEIPSESALFKADEVFGESPSADAADELLHAFEGAVIREAYQSAVAELRRAESTGDPEFVVQAQARCAQLSARLAKFS